MQGDGDKAVDLAHAGVSQNGRGQQPAQKTVQSALMAVFKGPNQLLQYLLVGPDPDNPRNMPAVSLALMAAVVD